MKRLSNLTLLAASLWLAASPVTALEAKYQASDLPTLAPEAQHQIASKRITSRFTRSHYQHFMLDDQFSKAIFDRYLSLLDYNRNLFTQQDMDAFQAWSVQLDDQLKAGNNQIAFDLYNLSMQRRFERYRYALTLLDKELNFDKDEFIELDRSKADWPKDEKALDELWYLRVKYDALTLKLAGKTWDEIKNTLEKRYNNTIKRLTQTNSEDVFQLYMNAFARQVDPHTSYLSPRNAEQFQSEMNLSLEGIGAVLQMTDDYTIVRSLVVGGPAAKSKALAEGDRIIGVGQAGKAIVDVVGWRLDDVVQLIKGPKGSEVQLQILPEGKDSKSHIVTLVRDKIRLEDRAVKSEIIEKEGKKIGVLEVPSFYVGLAQDTDKLLQAFNQEKVDGVIVDLRNNGGGALSEATALSGLFIKSGPIVQVRDSYGRVNVNSDTDQKMSYQGPLMVLINRYSASASEIFAAAMQDYGRAIILGENSFGKGTVQQHRSLNQIYDLFEKELGYVQYTIQKFYRIDGGSTQNKGVIPDIAFPSTVDPLETGESVEDNALPWDSIGKAQYQKLNDFQPVLDWLETRHQDRIKQNQEFSFIQQDLAKYQAEKADNRLSLNEKIRKQESEAAEQLRLDRVNLRQKAAGKVLYKTWQEVPKDYQASDIYLDESVAVMLDFLGKPSVSE